MPGTRPLTVDVAVLPEIDPGLIVQLPAGKPVNSTEPVNMRQVGCVMMPTVGATGVTGCGSTIIFVTVEMQPKLFCAVRVCEPEPAEYPPAGYAAYTLPSKLKIKPMVEDVIVMVPVAAVQVGCTIFTVGATGVGGCAFTTILVTGDKQKLMFCAISV